MTPVNDSPTPDDVSASGAEDAASIAVTLTDSNIDGTVQSFALASLPPGGTLYTDAGLTALAATATDYAATGESLTLYFVPDPDFNGAASFTYMITDAAGASNPTPATATLTVTAVNDDPVTVNDSATTDEDTAVTIAVLGNDSDADGDTLSVASVTQGANGSVLINGDNTVTYTPDANFAGADSFTYMITDAAGATDTATVSVNIAPDSTPTISVTDGQVDEAALSDGSSPGSPNETDTGTFTINTFGDTLATVTVGGVDVTGGGVVSGTYGVLTVTETAGAYSWSYTLSDNTLDHPRNPSSGTSDGIVDEFSVVVTDSDGDPSPADTLTIAILDDGPDSVDDDADVETMTGDRNIVIVFDRSGSMTADPGVDGFSERIDLARAAVASLLATAEQAGAVNVLIVDFATDADNSGWVSVDEANAYLAALVAGGLTDYEDATNEVKAAFPIDTPTAGPNLLYYLSDGEPTTGNFSDVSGWESFLDTNDISANAIGIGLGISVTDSDLEDVAYDGAADPAQQIDPIIVTDENQLIATLLSTLTVSAAGNVLTDPGPDPDNLVDSFGADGPGQIVSITVDTGLGGGDGITTFTYDGNEITNEDGLATIAGSDLVVTTDMGGEFMFDFLTGDYAYEASPENGGGAEIFDYSIEDADGDQSTAMLTITVPDSPDIEGLPLIAGTDSGETLNGTAVAEMLAGGDGSDTLNGLGGNDLLFGGDGVDTLNGGEGNDILVGGQGDDLITGGPGADIINVGSNDPGGSPNPNDSDSQDTVFYTSLLDAGDIIHNFDAGGGSHDTIDLDALLDSLGVATVDRAGVVQIVDGGDTEEVRLNADGNPDFEVLLVTVNLTSDDLDVGTDVVLGTLV